MIMDDNASVHRARAVENHKHENEIISITWPAHSPDLNIIENMWLYIKRQLQKSTAIIVTKNDLFRAIQSVCNRLICKT